MAKLINKIKTTDSITILREKMWKLFYLLCDESGTSDPKERRKHGMTGLREHLKFMENNRDSLYDTDFSNMKKKYEKILNEMSSGFQTMDNATKLSKI